MVVAADDIVLKILLQTSDDDHRLYLLVCLFTILQLQQGGSTRRGDFGSTAEYLPLHNKTLLELSEIWNIIYQ